jgi:hypothetical protein
MTHRFRRSCHFQPPCAFQALFVRNEEVRGSTPSAPPAQNPDRMGVFCAFGESLPDEFWANSSTRRATIVRLVVELQRTPPALTTGPV